MHIFDFKTKINCWHLVLERAKNESSIVPNMAHMANAPASWQQHFCAFGWCRICRLRTYRLRKYRLQWGVTGKLHPGNVSVGDVSVGNAWHGNISW